MVDFNFNDSSRCASNLIGDLDDLTGREGVHCLCPFVKAKFVREATEEDEESQQLFVNKLPS